MPINPKQCGMLPSNKKLMGETIRNYEIKYLNFLIVITQMILNTSDPNKKELKISLLYQSRLLLQK